MGDADRLVDALADETLPARQQRPLLRRAYVGPDQAAHLLDWVGRDRDLVLKRTCQVLGVVVWLGQALAFLIKIPAVVGATDPVCVRYAIGQRRRAVGTALLHQPWLASIAPVQSEILAQDSQPQHLLSVQVWDSRHRVPVTSQYVAHGRSRTPTAQPLVLSFREHPLLLCSYFEAYTSCSQWTYPRLPLTSHPFPSPACPAAIRRSAVTGKVSRSLRRSRVEKNKISRFSIAPVVGLSRAITSSPSSSDSC